MPGVQNFLKRPHVATIALCETCERPSRRGSMRAPGRVGAVTSLNPKPLIGDRTGIAPEAERLRDVPSRLADRLAAGDLDVALIPAIEYFRAGTYRVVPDVSIATRGPVLS